MPPGERHGLGVAMLADILTDAGYEVLNLGPDTPNVSFAAAIRNADLAAVVVSVVDIERRPAAGRLLAAARRERPSVPRLVGGNAVPDERVALDLGADGWVADPRWLGDLIDAQGTSMTIPLPPPVAGVPFDLETAAGRVAGYRLGEGRTVLLLHSFNAAGSGIELAPLASRLPSTDESCWSTGSDRHLGSARRALRLGILRRAARAHPVCRDAAGGDLRRCRRALTAGAVCRRRRRGHPQRFGRIVSSVRPDSAASRSAGRASRNIDRFLRLTGIGRLLFAVLARRQVIRWFLRQIFADPEQVPRAYERYCWRTCQQPGAFRAPLAFVSGCSMTPGPRAPTSGS